MVNLISKLRDQFQSLKDRAQDKYKDANKRW
jgi:hypothetical protein